jgi:feruloyl esterase
MTRVCHRAIVHIVVLLSLLGASASAWSQGAGSAPSCDALARLSLPNTTITAAQRVAPGEFRMPEQAGAAPRAGGPPPLDTAGMPEFCRVSATLKPSSDSNIRIEVWLPLSGWNGKYYAVGNSGWGGSIPYRGMVDGVMAHYATAGTDTGHDVGNGSFIPGHPEKFIDYGYRADHEMTLRAKELTRAFYSSEPRHSYWVGCSLGGMEALVEADRYPEDYDGIVAGAPMNPMSMFNAAQMWPAWLSQRYPEGIIPAAKFALMHDAVMQACASPIGLKQGFIEDPSSCKWDPAALLCKNGDAASCLTAAQVDVAHRFYQGPVNPRTGELIFPGPPFGTEGDIGRNGMTGPNNIAIDLYKYAVYQDPNWDYTTMDYDTAIDKARKVVDPVMRAGSNLNGFLNRGGKLLLHGGWAEWRNGTELRDYYLSVLKNGGKSRADQLRLFLIEGMGHCGGGNGPNQFDKLGVLDGWVDKGQTPNQLLTSKVSNGKVERTRPTCAWPATARYKGTGSEDEAASYGCGK